MTEETDVDTTGAGGKTNPPVSKVPVAGEDERLAKIVRGVLAEELKPIKGDIGGLYSRQDKQQNAFSDFLKEFNKAKASGLSDQDAQTQAESTLQDREKQLKREKALDLVLEKFGNDLPATAAGTSQSVTDEASQVFAKYKVDMNDPGAVDFLSLKGAELKAAVADYAFTKQNQPALDSSAATSLGSSPAPKVGVEGLTQKYQEDMKKARGNKSLLKSIKDTARKNGVPVDSITFV